MRLYRNSLTWACLLIISLVRLPSVEFADTQKVWGEEQKTVSAKEVLRAIDRSKSFLLSHQNGDGSWSVAGVSTHKIGITSLAVLALLNAGMTHKDAAVQKGLKYLRTVRDPEPTNTYDASLMLMALATAKEGTRDLAEIKRVAGLLERSQGTTGINNGSWGYNTTRRSNDGSDRSNGQFALLGLREAAHAGVPVSQAVWKRAKQHWTSTQNRDGSWGYKGSAGGSGYGSMTVAGISSLVICDEMLNQSTGNGALNCCDPAPERPELDRALEWMGKHFSSGFNPGTSTGRHRGIWLLYYHYGTERAGRLSGKRFFGQHDWYRAISRFLVDNQNKRSGAYKGVGGLETGEVVGTSLALLFLSKGLSPVLINKLEYGPTDDNDSLRIVGNNWNHHPHDARNLTQHISGLELWPKLVTWQTVNIKKAVANQSIGDLMQSPVLYICGEEAPQLTLQEQKLLKDYIAQGGFIIAVGTCNPAFEKGFRSLIEEMYRDDAISMLPLDPSHPVYRVENLIDPEKFPLEGANIGCRTAIIMARSNLDLSCLWNRWTIFTPAERSLEDQTRVQSGMNLGVNIIAYATGRKPPIKLDPSTIPVDAKVKDPIERGLIQVAKLKHDGGWDTAPQSVRNLLTELNQLVGETASLKQKALTANDPNIHIYPLVTMHGRTEFQLSEAERTQLTKYLSQGGLLFADACCGSRAFDTSFRKLVKELFPNQPLERIPVSTRGNQSHELFTSKVGFDIRTVRRQGPESVNQESVLNNSIRTVQPYLEGVKIDNRYVIIYSKYDLSCAMQKQTSAACSGYITQDAFKIAVNIVLYAMLQDVNYKAYLNPSSPAK